MLDIGTDINMVFILTHMHVSDAEIMKLNGKLAEKKAEVNQKIICKLVEAGYQIIEENFRSIAKLVPTSALFSNL